ncbi:hypothetical protein Tco_0943627 [Tanacetum coccineum]
MVAAAAAPATPIRLDPLRKLPASLHAYGRIYAVGASLANCAFGILGIHHLTWKLFQIVIMLELVLTENPQQEVLWIQNQMLDYRFNFMNTKIYIDNESIVCIVKNPVFHSKTKNIEIRHHFIRDSYEKRLIQVIKIHTDHNVVDLLTKAFDISSDEFRFKTGSGRVNTARQDLVLLGKSYTVGLPLLLLVTIGDNTVEGD